MSQEPCPCGLQDSYAECCGLYHGGATAPTAEALMRSRYSAFAKKLGNYLRETTDPQTRDQFDHEAQARWANQAQFLELEILRSEEKGNKATVEFRARFLMNEAEETHHEISRFRQQGGDWYYREGREIKK